MKTIVLLAVIAFVSAQTDQGTQNDQGNKTEQGNKNEQGNTTEEENKAEQGNKTERNNKTKQGNKTEQGDKTEQGNKTEPLLVKSPALQEIYDCKPGEKCADDIVKATDKFAEAAEKACPNCSQKTKKHMALFADAIKSGMSVKKAQRLYNPNNKYFDIVDNAQMTALK